MIKKRHAALKARDEAEAEWKSLVETQRRAKLPLDRYAGKYSNPAFGTAEISLENGSFVYKRTAQQTLDLAVKEKNVFVAKYRNPTEDLRSGKEKAEFIMKDGNVVELVENDAIHFTRIN